MVEFLNHDSFLGSRASVMMDVVFLAMFAVVPVMLWSIFSVKYRRRYVLHKRVQLSLGVVLGIAVTLFEVHVRMHGWQHRLDPDASLPLVWTVLILHLSFCIPTTFLWAFVLIQALRKIPKPPGPCSYSRRHAFWGRLAAAGMILTAVSGTTFYWVAFVSGEVSR